MSAAHTSGAWEAYRKKAEADARLKDAAPDLLKALQGLTKMYANTWDTEEGGLAMFSNRVKEFEKAHRAARAAIKKATGGEP